MTAWHRGPMLAFDLETTGPNPDTARIVTATLIHLGPEGIGQTHEWLVDPGIPIPLGASEIHGVTTEHAREHGVPASQAVSEISLAILAARGTPLVAFNAAYDFTVLHREALRHGGVTLTPMPVVDPHVIDKHVDPYRRGKRTLTATSSHYGVELTQAHHSLADALAAARLAFKLAQQYPAQLKIPLPDLHAAQRGWRHEQAASLQAHFRRTKDPEAVVNGDWPIQTLPPGWTPNSSTRSRRWLDMAWWMALGIGCAGFLGSFVVGAAWGTHPVDQPRHPNTQKFPIDLDELDKPRAGDGTL